MNDFRYICACDLNDCKLFLENPIVLPCGSTICYQHIENLIDDFYKCSICKQDHDIPENGFPPNKLALKINQCEIHLNNLHKKTISSYKELENIVNDHEKMNSDNVIHEYFSNLKNQVDLHREVLIDQINKESESILNELKEHEEDCRTKSVNLKKLNLDKLMNEDLDEFKHKLRKSYLNTNELNRLLNEIDEIKDEIIYDIKRFKIECLMKKFIEFEILKNSIQFSHLKTENAKYDDPNIGSQVTITIRLEIDNFSKFRDNQETRFSQIPCIVKNLPWKIQAVCEKSISSNIEILELGFYLKCNFENKPEGWAVSAEAELGILHLSDPKKNLFKNFKHLFLPNQDSLGCKFISIKDLTDPKNGFFDSVKDCVILEARFKASRSIDFS